MILYYVYNATEMIAKAQYVIANDWNTVMNGPSKNDFYIKFVNFDNKTVYQDRLTTLLAFLRNPKTDIPIEFTTSTGNTKTALGFVKEIKNNGFPRLVPPIYLTPLFWGPPNPSGTGALSASDADRTRVIYHELGRWQFQIWQDVEFEGKKNYQPLLDINRWDVTIEKLSSIYDRLILVETHSINVLYGANHEARSNAYDFHCVASCDRNSNADAYVEN